MTFQVEFECDNVAFEDEPASEIARILCDIANRVREGDTSGRARDVNGNPVGSWKTVP